MEGVIPIIKNNPRKLGGGHFIQRKIVPPHTFQKSPICKACALQGHNLRGQNFASLAPCKAITYEGKFLQTLHVRLRLDYLYSLFLPLFSKFQQGENFWGILLVFISEQSRKPRSGHCV